MPMQTASIATTTSTTSHAIETRDPTTMATLVSQSLSTSPYLPLPTTSITTALSSPTTSSTSATSPTQQPLQPHESTLRLPGTKRGIAIGVAVSIATILILAVAYLSIKYRQKMKLRFKAASLEDGISSEHKNASEKCEPTELDARNVVEVGDEVRQRELSTYIEDGVGAQELEAKAVSFHELDAMEPVSPLAEKKREQGGQPDP